MLLENKVLRCFQKVARHSQKRTLWGSEFQRVGADAWKEREPNRSLVRGTWRSLDAEEREALVGTQGHKCLAT